MADACVRTVVTAAATIKFTGGVDNDSSASDSEAEQENPQYPSNQDESNITNNNRQNNSLDNNALKTASTLDPNDNDNPERQQVSETDAQNTVREKEIINNSKSVPSPNQNISPRFNPFDKEEYDPNQRLFPQANSASGPNNSSGSSSSWPDTSLTEQEDAVTNKQLGVEEDHFGLPEGHASSVEEIELAINNCKLQILDTVEHTERRRNLVQKLVQLRLKLSELKEGPEEVEEGIKLVVGHHFEAKESPRSKHYCEKCNSVIWGVLQSWYRCNDCGFCCHAKCLNLITRTCASVKVVENPSYILSISPEKGLSQQNYRCAECKTQISYQAGLAEPRQCDYTGAYYCDSCHWNDTMILPARILHNWDFEPRKVCRASKQFLRLMVGKAVIRVQDINPMLFSFVEELNDVKRLREEILIMKKYFLTCKAALGSKLLLQLRDRQHFVESSDLYSLQDLMDVSTDVLLPALVKIHASFAQHIKTDCQRCQGQGYICELCDYEEVLFPFDNHAIVCAQCSTVLHRHCYMRRNQRCPKCDRITKRSKDGEGTSKQL